MIMSPYIKPDARPQFDRLLRTLARRIVDNPGYLNYCVTRLVDDLWTTRPEYKTAALITGVLVNVKDEFTRRLVVPYEEGKRDENGDVYGSEAFPWNKDDLPLQRRPKVKGKHIQGTEG